MSNHIPNINSSYLKPCFDPARLPLIIQKMAKALKKYENDFDTIVFRGMSGALVGPAVAAKMKKHILIIRKNDGNHFSKNAPEGNYGLKRYVIVDDFVSSGNTVNVIIDTIHQYANDEARCVGMAIYIPASNSDVDMKNVLPKEAFVVKVDVGN